MTTVHRPRIALVTGSSRGLGKSMALHLADHGVDVVVTYRSARGEADAVVEQVRAKGRKAVALPLDVADAETFPAFAESLARELRRVWERERFDILIHNAGHGVHASIAETTEAQLDSLYDVHLKGPFLLTQRLSPQLEDGGRILHVSSGLTRFSMPGYAAYAAMKGAVEVLTRYLAKELGPRKISVNTLAPGAIETDFGGGVVRDDARVNAAIASQTALGRVGLPDDVGAAVAALLGPDAQWINAQRVEVSGGMFV